MSTSRHVYTIDDLRRLENAGGNGELPIRLAVIGDPVAHSASPPMHTAALESHGIPCAYIRLHVRPDELPEAISLLVPKGFWGVNLTIPHKAAVIPLLNEVDPRAATLGVVNTVAVKDGKLKGYNTDGGGLAKAIQADFGVNLGDQKVVVLGAGGGAGRAIAIQCFWEGCPEITLANRTLSKVQSIAAELTELSSQTKPRKAPKIEAVTFECAALERAVKAADLLIQCTSIGMQDGDPSPIPSGLLDAHHLVYDTIYSRPTQLLADAKFAGARGSNGLSMLLHQGALAFEIWFPAKQAPVTLMRDALLTALPPASH